MTGAPHVTTADRRRWEHLLADRRGIDDQEQAPARRQVAVRSKHTYANDAAPDPGSGTDALSVRGVSWAVLSVRGVMGRESEVRDVGRAAAVCEIVAGVAALRGPQGLEELVVDLARELADVVERIATAEGLAAEDVARILLFGEDPDPGTVSWGAAMRLHERYPEASAVARSVEASRFPRGT
jgi:hypothetical protein